MGEKLTPDKINELTGNATNPLRNVKQETSQAMQFLALIKEGRGFLGDIAKLKQELGGLQQQPQKAQGGEFEAKVQKETEKRVQQIESVQKQPIVNLNMQIVLESALRYKDKIPQIYQDMKGSELIEEIKAYIEKKELAPLIETFMSDFITVGYQ